MFHASSDGKKRIFLPDRRNVFDLDSGAVVGENIKEFSFELSQGDTALFELV